MDTVNNFLLPLVQQFGFLPVMGVVLYGPLMALTAVLNLFVWWHNRRLMGR